MDDWCPLSDYPCGFCHDNCDGYKCVGCDKCEDWFHQNCEGLSNAAFNYLKNCTLPYICSRCCENNFGVFDYDKSLGRLEFAIQSGCFEMGVRMETIFMRREPKRLLPKQAFRFEHSMSIDHLASDLVGKSDFVPVLVRGNGNCLFNALSIAIQGNEKLASEIRVRTCLEMFYHKDFYINSHKRDRMALVSPPYEEAVGNCAQNFKFSSAWTIHAAATVISRCIKSLYPPVHGLLDPSVSILNCEFRPRALQSKHTINILWCSMIQDKSGNCLTNHFVPLLPPAPMNVIDIDLSPSSFEELASLENSSSNNPPLSPSRTSGLDHPYSKSPKYLSLNNSDQECDQKQPPLSSTKSSSSDLHYGKAKTRFSRATIETDNLPKKKKQNRSSDIFSMKIEAIGRVDNSFFDAVCLLDMFKSFPVSKALPSIPPGLKNNVYFIIKNTANIDSNKRISFPDDCGTWSKGSAPKTYFLQQESGEYRNIVLRNEMFHFQKRSKGKCIYILMEPQPDPSKIVTLSRYYAALKLDPTYRRRISRMNSSSVFVVEYLGLFPGMAPHGNSKRKQAYVHAPYDVMEEMPDFLEEN
ncbi:uncharacterized protein LOC133188496 isoform X2 [Saccostrea echinata]|uniref:uncharacterized protein LOC133188496 isoform X2 n=1 Tax=Saccostrea echinata TaxID=191078 RepID=UPI002A83E39D|nr:uncharacterized protein LOC133188496 isoform X2 [Saccostrea echinata]